MTRGGSRARTPTPGPWSPAAPVIVDTNVVAAGFLTPDRAAATRLLLDAMLRGRLFFLLSLELLAEYGGVLARPSIAARHGRSEREIQEILVTLAEHGAVREPAAPSARGVPRGDAHLFTLLEAEPRSILVTGDAAVAERAGRRAISPRGWFERLERLGSPPA